MFDKIIKKIVYLLSFLIIISLFGIIYGMYRNISSKSLKNSDLATNISLSLDQDQEIKNMQVIKEGRILITVGNDHEIQGIVYDLNNQKIIQRINK